MNVKYQDNPMSRIEMYNKIIQVLRRDQVQILPYNLSSNRKIFSNFREIMLYFSDGVYVADSSTPVGSSLVSSQHRKGITERSSLRGGKTGFPQHKKGGGEYARKLPNIDDAFTPAELNRYLMD